MKPHLLNNNGVALNGVGCSCGWSARAQDNEERRLAFERHREGWDECTHHPEWVNKFDRTNTCNHPDCKREAGR